jgi:hypothetical protein
LRQKKCARRPGVMKEIDSRLGGDIAEPGRIGRFADKGRGNRLAATATAKQQQKQPNEPRMTWITPIKEKIPRSHALRGNASK